MQFPYKMVAFDLDGTLTKSKEPITKETASLLHDLSLLTKVVVISGGSFLNFQEQLLHSLEPSPNIILLPTEGSERFEYDSNVKEWKMTDKEIFSGKIKKEVTRVLKEIIASGKYDIPSNPKGEYIEDRDTEITFSALGQKAPLEKKEKWDPDHKKRFKIKEAIEAKIDNIMVAVAGTTSLDILPKGFNKAKGLRILLEKLGIGLDEIVFVGDAIVPGGNDYSVFEAGIKSIKVNGPKDTENIIKEMLKSAGDEKSVPEEKYTYPIFPLNPIAYFCAEYALDVNPSMYAGGLGILAGDYVLEASDENIPFIALGLRYGKSIPSGFLLLRNIIIDIPIGVDIIKAAVWHRSFSENVHVLLLDTKIDENTEENKKITSHLYDMDFYTRIKQQMVLGIGGIRLLSKLGIYPKIYHLNEGHTAFAALAIAVEQKSDLGKIVATKHTILSEAGLLIKLSDFKTLIGPYCKAFGVAVKEVFEKGKFESSTDLFSTTKFIIVSAVRKNGVSDLHIAFEKKRHPHSTLISITNGVYRKRWQAKELFLCPPTLSDAELCNIKRKLKMDLFDYIENVSGKRLNPDICTLVWARRFAGYKRPHLLFSDLKRLTTLLSSPDMPLQCIISGKPHKGDAEAKDIRDRIIAFSNSPGVKGRVVYLPDYSLLSAEKLTRGADIWLNTPELGKEACGTSGIKASLNGTLQCSVSDGWVNEVNWEGRGWTLPGDRDAVATAEVLYDLLGHEILPSFYEESEDFSKEWLTRMRSTIELVEKSYTAKRMLRDYAEKLYKL